MLKTEHEDTQNAIADVKALIEALDALGGAGPLCGAGTAADRFVVNDPMTPTEVCDNTTGLYWEYSPSTGSLNWADAVAHCATLGNGYTLPQVKQLISLVDYGETNPSRPPGHPFDPTAVPSATYWSATTFANNPANAWMVHFGDGRVFFSNKGFVDIHVWCVR